MSNTTELSQSLIAMAQGFRGGNHIALGTELPDVLALIVDRTVNVAHTSPETVHALIQKCLFSFEHADWLGLADILEYEVAAVPIEKH